MHCRFVAPSAVICSAAGHDGALIESVGSTTQRMVTLLVCQPLAPVVPTTCSRSERRPHSPPTPRTGAEPPGEQQLAARSDEDDGAAERDEQKRRTREQQQAAVRAGLEGDEHAERNAAAVVRQRPDGCGRLSLLHHRLRSRRPRLRRRLGRRRRRRRGATTAALGGRPVSASRRERDAPERAVSSSPAAPRGDDTCTGRRIRCRCGRESGDRDQEAQQSETSRRSALAPQQRPSSPSCHIPPMCGPFLEATAVSEACQRGASPRRPVGSRPAGRCLLSTRLVTSLSRTSRPAAAPPTGRSRAGGSWPTARPPAAAPAGLGLIRVLEERVQVQRQRVRARSVRLVDRAAGAVAADAHGRARVAARRAAALVASEGLDGQRTGECALLVLRFLTDRLDAGSVVATALLAAAALVLVGVLLGQVDVSAVALDPTVDCETSPPPALRPSILSCLRTVSELLVVGLVVVALVVVGLVVVLATDRDRGAEVRGTVLCSAAESPIAPCSFFADWPIAWIAIPPTLRLLRTLSERVQVRSRRGRADAVRLVDRPAAAGAVHASRCVRVARTVLEAEREGSCALFALRLLAHRLDAVRATTARGSVLGLVGVLLRQVAVQRRCMRVDAVRLGDVAVIALAVHAHRGVRVRCARLQRCRGGQRVLLVLGLLADRPGCPSRTGPDRRAARSGSGCRLLQTSGRRSTARPSRRRRSCRRATGVFVFPLEPQPHRS